MICRIPDTARRALALWTTLGGMASRGIGHSIEIVALKRILVDGCEELTPSPGDVFLVVTLRCDNCNTHTHTHTQQTECLRLALFAGSIDQAWWECGGKDQTRRAWNALAQDEREREWRHWVSTAELDEIAAALLAKGVTKLVDQQRCGGVARGQA